MKNDMGLLLGIGAALAIALTIAVARGALPVPAVFNPLGDCSRTYTIAAVVGALALFVASATAIFLNDRPLVPPLNSAALEWVYSSDKAAEVVKQYGAHRSTAIRGVMIDNVAFIPSYVLLLAVLGFAVGRGWTTQPAWAAWAVAMGWTAVFAGAFDYLENAGIYAALGGLTTRLAPLTYAACQLKWTVAFTAAFFSIIAFAIRCIR